MRIEKKGNHRNFHAPTRALAPRVARTPLVLLALLAVAAGTAGCSKSKDASADSSAISKSTLRDTSAATGQMASASSSAKKARVVILGTSLTAGLGLDPSEAYPALLQQLADSAKYSVNIVAAGLSGETSAGALRRASWVLDQPADAVVLEVGANDGLRGVNPDSTRANIEAVVDVIHNKYPSAKVVLVQMEAPPNFGRDYTTRFHTAYAAAAKNKQIELLPFLLDSVAGVASLNQGDGIHPNKTGSHIVARNMLRALAPLFTELQTVSKP